MSSMSTYDEFCIILLHICERLLLYISSLSGRRQIFKQEKTDKQKSSLLLIIIIIIPPSPLNILLYNCLPLLLEPVNVASYHIIYFFLVTLLDSAQETPKKRGPGRPPKRLRTLSGPSTSPPAKKR